VFHPQRLKNMFRDVLLEGLAAHTLYDVPSESYPIVRIGRHFARRKDPPWLVRDQEVSEWRRLLWVGKKNVANLFLKPAGVGHQVPQADGLAESRRDFKIEILVYIRVDVQLTLFRQLHNRNPSEQFGDRSQTKHRRFGINRFFLRDVRKAVALPQQILAIFHH